MTPTVTFVVPVRNDATRLAWCLASIAASDDETDRIEVIVADNGSTDNSAQVARQAGARVLVLPGRRVGDLRNRAAAQARGTILAFVDADHELADGWIAAAVDALSHPGVAAAGAPYLSPENGTWVQRTYGGLRAHPAGRQEVEWLGSGNLAVKRAAFLRVHGFDATLESCEDVDFCQRLRQAGYRIVSDSRLRSTHLGDPPTLRWLFMSELWRARNNLRASVRGPFSWRALPSAAIPVIDALSLVLALAAVAPPFRSGLVAGAALGVVVALAALRAARILKNLRAVNATSVAQAFVVALTYDLARAVAPLLRARHYRRPPAPPHAPMATEARR